MVLLRTDAEKTSEWYQNVLRKPTDLKKYQKNVCSTIAFYRENKKKS